jgi:drug/metabolite transporter (DMT)-like permease
VLSAAQLLVATVLLVPALAVDARTPGLDPAVLGAVAALGLGGTGVAYVLNYRLIADEGPTAASTVTYLIPLVAVALGVAVLDEPLGWNLAAGTAAVLAGVALAQRPRGQEAAAASGRA